MDPISYLHTNEDLRVPIIDLAPYLRGEPNSLEQTASALRSASEDLGFYFLTNHNIDGSLIERMFEQSKRFHDLPLEKKLAIKVVNKVVGYLPQGGQTQRTSIYGKSSHPDTSASYYIRKEYASDHPDRLSNKSWIFDNQWISDLPDFKETVLEYFEAMERLVSHLLSIQCRALNLAENFLNLHDAFNPPVYNLRLLHYPPRDKTLDGQFGIGPHTDYGYLTILAQGDVPGLEILNKKNQWIDVPVLKDCLLINNADLCSRWTNDKFRSAPHRVINKTGETRYSIPFFVAPRSDVNLECFDSCCSDADPPKYKPITAGEYFAAINQNNYDVLKK